MGIAIAMLVVDLLTVLLAIGLAKMIRQWCFIGALILFAVMILLRLHYGLHYPWMFVLKYAITVAVPLVMAWAGNHLAAESTKSSMEKNLWRGLFFTLTVFALIGSFLVMSQEEAAHQKELADLKKNVEESTFTGVLKYNQANPQHPITGEQFADFAKSLNGRKQFVTLKTASLPCTPGRPRVSVGPDGYKGVCDEDLGQWMLDEYRESTNLADDCMYFMTTNPTEHSVIQWRFKLAFDQHVQDLRTEALARLGPLGKNSTEQEFWDVLFPQERIMRELPDNIPPDIRARVLHSVARDVDCSSVQRYMLYFRVLGVKMKRKVTPRRGPAKLKFTEIKMADPQFKFSVNATVDPSIRLNTGYIVVELSGPPAGRYTECKGGKNLVNPGPDTVANPELIRYLQGLPYYTATIEIGRMPVGPDNIFSLRAVSTTEVHVTNIIWFDD